MIRVARKNGIVITANEWLKDFPHKFYESFYPRSRLNEKLYFSQKREEWKTTLVPKAFYDGDQNWLNKIKYPKTENWNPSENANFTVVHEWPHLIITKEKTEYFIEKFNQNN